MREAESDDACGTLPRNVQNLLERSNVATGVFGYLAEPIPNERSVFVTKRQDIHYGRQGGTIETFPWRDIFSTVSQRIDFKDFAGEPPAHSPLKGLGIIRSK